MNEITVGFDGSGEATGALEWAAAEARALHATLKVVQSWKEPVLAPDGNGVWLDPAAEVQKVHDRFEAQVAAVMDRHLDVPFTCELIDEPPARGLVERSADASMLVVGGRGQGGFHGLQIGSVAKKVARHAEVPVVVVRGPADQRDRPDVVVGVDGSSCSRNALAWAAREAERIGKRLVVLMGWSYLAPQGLHGVEPFRPDYRAEDANAVLAAIVADVLGPAPAIEVVRRAVCEMPARTVLDHADDACLLVVGHHGDGHWSPLELGTTSQQVIHHALGPVAVIPAPAPPG